MLKFKKAICLCMVVAATVVVVAAQSDTQTDGNAASRAVGATNGQQVVVEKDGFSGATTVKLKPQELVNTPEHQLTMSAEVKLEGKTYADGSSTDETVLFEFISRSKQQIDFGDEELHFLVDGKPVKGGPTSDGMYKPDLRGERYIGGVRLSYLQQIAKGKNVAMRLGSVKLTLDEKVLSNLRDFARATNMKR